MENVYKKALQLIIDVGFDYDNAKTVEDFKELVDDIAEIARRGLDSDEVLLAEEELGKYFNRNV